ncbi:hypothetical protein DFH27DRAFT_644780 [Peziza echinospora]|nr:hypothetical protein DFH27DRAFT_644780 [Peziza echinospora]
MTFVRDCADCKQVRSVTHCGPVRKDLQYPNAKPSQTWVWLCQECAISGGFVKTRPPRQMKKEEEKDEKKTEEEGEKKEEEEDEKKQEPLPTSSNTVRIPARTSTSSNTSEMIATTSTSASSIPDCSKNYPVTCPYCHLTQDWTIICRNCKARILG